MGPSQQYDAMGVAVSWTKLDDRWDLSTKLIRARSKVGDSADAMWARATNHCNRENTDGKIHGAVLRSLTANRKPQAVIDTLVAVGAIEVAGQDEYQMHDFLDWNDSKETIDAKRLAKQLAGKTGGTSSGVARRAAKQGASTDEAEGNDTRSKNEASASQVVRDSFANIEPSPLLSSPSEIPDIRSLETPVDISAKGRGKPEFADEVDAVWAHWQACSTKASGKSPRSKLDATRRTKILTRIRDGYSVEDICRGIDGCWSSEHHATNGFTDIELICRNSVKLDAFIAKAAPASKPLERKITQLETNTNNASLRSKLDDMGLNWTPPE